MFRTIGLSDLQTNVEKWQRVRGTPRENDAAESILASLEQLVQATANQFARQYPNIAEFDDLAQAARLAIFAALPRYDGGRREFGVYIHEVVRGAVQAACFARASLYYKEQRGNPVCSATSIDDLAAVENSVALYQVIDKLPDREALVIRALYYKACTQEEVATQLGISRQRVQQIANTALKSLRELLE